MKFALILSFQILIFCSAVANEYAVSNIPASLLRNANAVMRISETSIQINSARKTIIQNHYVITILNEAGDYWAKFTEYYDNFRSIVKLEGALYDASGKLLRRVKKKEFGDFSAASETALADDVRIREYNFYHRKYPYTIEYSVEVVSRATMFLPLWAPQMRSGLSVQKASLEVQSGLDEEYRYQHYNYSGAPVVRQDRKKLVRRWEIQDKKPQQSEYFSPRLHELTTMVLLGPTRFKMDGIEGNMESWDDFGKFINLLRKDRDQLPNPVREKVRQLTAAVPDTLQKIEVLYKYMQQTTRYVSIQLGMGGWQPYDAAYVASRGYGDCKALTNYMYALLKEAGIRSVYALVRAGENDTYLTTDFPSQQFNHVILCVPRAKDSIWLECTSQSISPGYLGGFTANRPALLVEESGSELVSTARYGLKENQQQRLVMARLSETGELLANVTATYKAMMQDNLHQMMHHQSPENIRQHLQLQLDLPTYEITDFEYHEHKSVLPAIYERLQLRVSNYANISGKRMFIRPNLLTRSSLRLDADPSRNLDIVLHDEFVQNDSVQISLPAGYRIESIPASRTLSTIFGSYSMQVEIRGDTIFYHRHLERRRGRFPSDSYSELVKFVNEIYFLDRVELVFVKEQLNN